MRSKLALATLLSVALVAPAALPCGAPFGDGINVDPNQDIIVAHKNGNEAYVFQPRFCGSAAEFGLILPIPAKLATQPALSQADVFRYLDSISQPKHVAVTKCGQLGNWGAGGGRSGGDAGSTVVVSSGSVGFMDYSQLATSSLASLTAWLDSNGYPYDALATSAFQYYVDKGWYFVAFKVNQGALTGVTTCKDLGPVKLAFPTPAPVVPTRMATARSQDKSGVLSYYPGFSWRVFGLTAAAEQIGFADGEDGLNRVLTYSGLLSADDVTHLDGLAAAGDRADKLTLTFSYGSTDPDIALNLGPGTDYRQIIEDVTYVQCDGGMDSAMPDAAENVDGAVWRDASPIGDVAVPRDLTAADTGPTKRDLGATTINLDAPPVGDGATVASDSAAVTAPEVGKSDAAVALVTDAASAIPGADAGPDAPAARDAAPTPSEPKTKGGGWCSFSASSSGSGPLWPLFLAGLLLALRRRRR